ALLRRLAADPAAGRAVGCAGRARLEADHTPAGYAARVAEVAAGFAPDAARSIGAKLIVNGLGSIE
ncbi:MAG: hypothetical protein AAFO58_07020, partial [Pseudomonadota bacterium]